jgi:1-phosphatidylinositol-3-phosphate 5-kinase
VPPAERQPNQLPSRERGISRGRNGSNATDKLTIPDQHPPVIQVSQSYLPGFHASRETSVDGDRSSVTSGTKAAGKMKFDESRPTIVLPEVTPASAARLRSKVLPKELWMRDETAKECFYCGEPFSTFRRKHHCRM